VRLGIQAIAPSVRQIAARLQFLDADFSVLDEDGWLGASLEFESNQAAQGALLFVLVRYISHCMSVDFVDQVISTSLDDGVVELLDLVGVAERSTRGDQIIDPARE
jgi:hypothetical protein